MKDLISFQVLEDSRPLFISEGKNLRTFQSDVPEKANAMAPQIGQFVLMRQQFENMENMARMLEKQGGDHQQNQAKEYHGVAQQRDDGGVNKADIRQSGR